MLKENSNETPKKLNRKRRKKRTAFKDSLESLLAKEVPKEALPEAIRKSSFEKISYQEAILLAQIIKASNGDTQAAVFLRDSSGNKLKEGEKVQVEYKKFEDF
jgi:hypothetical protein